MNIVFTHFTLPSPGEQDNKVSEGQQQWWQFKAQNFDSVLLFKMGKFYEVGQSALVRGTP